jgi:hypothetical protein
MRRVAAIGLAILVAACASGPRLDSAPSEAQALQHLESIIAFVQAGDVSRICDYGGPTCSMSIDRLDPQAVPHGRPTIMSIRTIPPIDHGDGTWSNGLVLIELCGIDGLGKTYQSGMQVYWNRGRIVATEPAYWLGIGFATDPVVGAPTGPPEACRVG